jgi:hypothetical protein
MKTALLLIALLAFACVTTTAADIPLTSGATKVKTGKADADPGQYEEVGPIEASSGSGCGGFGSRGTYEATYNALRNRAAEMKADYVEIMTMTEPHANPGCFDNAFVIRGMAYRLKAAPAVAK